MPLFNGKQKQSAPSALIDILDDDLIDRIAPAMMDFSHVDCCAFSPGEWVRVWYVRDWPRDVGIEHWRALLRFAGDVRISMFFHPLAPGLVSKQLEQRATAIQASRFLRAQQKRDASPAEDEDYQQIMEERYRIEVEGEPLYFVTTCLALFGASKEDLDNWSRKLEDLCRDAGIVIDRAAWQQDRGLVAMLPHNIDALRNHQRNARLDTIANLFPWISGEVLMPGGVFWGYGLHNGAAVVLDPFGLENPNIVIAGIPGAGKSYWMKDHLEQYLLAGARVFVLDIEDEYRRLCEDLGGVYLDMGVKSAHKINVLDPDPEDEEGLAGAYQGFRGWVASAIERPLLPQEIEALDVAYYRAFARYGISKDDPATLRRTPPILSDLYDELKALGTQAGEALASALWPMARGMESEAFNCRTNIDVRGSPLVVFGLRTVGEAMKPRRIRQIQVFTWNQMLRSRAGRALARTIEVVDEAWYLLQFADTARDLCERARRFRKKNASLVIATQQVDDFLANPYAATILGLASTHLLFGQKPTAVGRLAELFQLTAGEAGQLTRLDPGQYFLKTSKLRMFLYKPAPPDRHRLYTTKPSELLAMAEGA